MEIERENKIKLTWNVDGRFSACLVNGRITELNFCEVGVGSECGSCLQSTDLKYLQNVHKALSELFKMMDEENKSNGHSYAKEAET